MKLMASGVTCSAASVRSPSFSRSSSSTTTTIRPARISAMAPGTSMKGDSKVRWLSGIGNNLHSRRLRAPRQRELLKGNKNATRRRRFVDRHRTRNLQSRLDLKAPCFKERLRNVLGVFVPTGPLSESGGPDVLIRGQLELLDDLLEGGHGGDDGPDGLRLAPIRISSAFCHLVFCSSERSGIALPATSGDWWGSWRP